MISQLNKNPIKPQVYTPQGNKNDMMQTFKLKKPPVEVNK